MLKVNHLNEQYHANYTEEKQVRQFVIFTVNNEEFGVEAQKVIELIGYIPPLKIPNAYKNVAGMANFRGKIIPIVDLRIMFGLEPANYNELTVSIIVETNSNTFGIIAETVLDMLPIPAASIKTISNFNFGEKTKYLKGVANLAERLILVLDLDKIIEYKTIQKPFEHTLQTNPTANQPIGSAFFKDPDLSVNTEARELRDFKAPVDPGFSRNRDSDSIENLEQKQDPGSGPGQIELENRESQTGQAANSFLEGFGGEAPAELLDSKELENILSELEGNLEPKIEESLSETMNSSQTGPNGEPPNLETGKDAGESNNIVNMLQESSPFFSDQKAEPPENIGPQSGLLPDSTIEAILKQLEAESRPQKDDLTSGLLQIKGPEEKPDV